ncbi:DUF2884 family protein [Glaciecola sp. 2405UD65-10]|uniref:DUF2884 family protein n=1 Tax=Glaciecola sp. 2405UD65-10 TaxID=3397244 RepID=UPI003B590731
MKNFTLPLVAFVSSAFIAFSAQAQSFSNNQCNADFKGDVVFENNLLQVFPTKQQVVTFNSAGKVTVDGSQISLSSAQTDYAKAYYANAEAAIPIVVDISSEAIQIANVSLSETAIGILGPNTKLPKMIDTKLMAISEAIKGHVYANPDSLTFKSAQLEKDLGGNEGFDDEISKVTTEMTAAFTAELLQSVMSGKTNFEDVEKRLESLGEEIEEKAEALAEQLEDKTKLLCEKLEAIDTAETELQSISALSNLNIIVVGK